MVQQFNEQDKAFMKKALSLAWKGRYNVSPNPRVGCVIVKNNQIIGEGYHQQAGTPHAEIWALKMAQEHAKNATAYVTLEPCNHYGKTPPCTKALIEAQIKKVIVAILDPNPLVSGQGLATLNAANIETQIGLLAKQAQEINHGFLSRIERHRPFVSIKSAMSIDGKIALKNGQSKWITSEKSRLDVQEWRAQSCAILTGVNTILTDDPLLNVRTINTLRQPIRIIVDSQLRTPIHAKVVQDTNSFTWIITTETNKLKYEPYLEYSHVSVLSINPTQDGRIDLDILMKVLAQKEIGSLLVEAGSTLTGELLTKNLVDELIIYQAPIILGHQAHSSFCLPDLQTLKNIQRWKVQDSQFIDNDHRLILRLT